MTYTTLFFVVIGVTTVTNWLFKLIDIIEAPAKKGVHNGMAR